MSPVDFKKWPCRPVEFKGEGPLYMDVDTARCTAGTAFYI